MVEFFILLIGLAIFLSLIEFIRGRSLSNKVIAFDTMNIISVSLLVILSVSLKDTFYLDIAFVFALISFIGTIVFARFNIIKSKYV